MATVDTYKYNRRATERKCIPPVRTVVILEVEEVYRAAAGECAVARRL